MASQSPPPWIYVKLDGIWTHYVPTNDMIWTAVKNGVHLNQCEDLFYEFNSINLNIFIIFLDLLSSYPPNSKILSVQNQGNVTVLLLQDTSAIPGDLKK